MEFNFASRLDSFEEGIFATLNDKKNELVKAGRKVYNMSVGTPDFKPAQHIMDAVSEAASKPENYKYALADLPELLDAVSNHPCQEFFFKFSQHTTIAFCHPVFFCFISALRQFVPPEYPRT